MRTARRYLAHEIYRSSAVMLIALVGLFSFFALIEDLDSVGPRFTLANLFYLQLLSLPARTYELLPIALLIGAVLALAGLAQRNELVILRVSGVSGLKLLASLWILTLPLVAGAFLLSEFFTPAAELKASEASMKLLGRAQGGRMQSGYWFRESDRHGGTRIINISELKGSGEVAGIAIYEFRNGQELATMSYAATGSFGDRSLVLRNLVETRIDADAVNALNTGRRPDKPMTVESPLPERTLQTTLTQERLIARVLTPERMAMNDLADYIDYLESNQLQTERQVVALWRKAAYPFTLLVMITIAAPIGFMQTRRGGVGGKVFAGILLGVGFFMLNQLALNVGMLGRWPPWLTALLPSVVGLVIALGSLLLLENQHRIFRLLRGRRHWTNRLA